MEALAATKPLTHRDMWMCSSGADVFPRPLADFA
jgi:hypothetical protein